MRSQLAYLVVSTLLGAEAAPHYHHSLVARDNTTYAIAILNGTTTASLPQSDGNKDARKAEVETRRKGFVYGSSLMGEASSFALNGTLGNERVAKDMALWDADSKAIEADVSADLAALTTVIDSNGGLKNLEDYTKVLYKDQWKKTITRPAAGMLANYTQDLLFSMERLSQNPYPLKVVGKKDKLPFKVDDSIVKNITSDKNLKAVQKAGRLFIVDHKYQSKYEKTKKFGAFCTAYFFIHPKSKDFLPLAIKTNTGKDLIYTPKDSSNDWLLAKIMFNVNDLFDSQMGQMVATHAVAEAVHQASLRTLSDSHPVMVILDRLMNQAYSARQIAEKQVFSEGGHWDENFFISSKGAKQFVKEFYPTAGAFQKNYVKGSFKTRGLVDSKNKSKFKSFPFLDDTTAINKHIHTFMKSVVDSYYGKDKDLAKDSEIQNWFIEAKKEAKVIDFPKCGKKGKECNKKTLVEVLTHFAYLTGVAHNVLSGGDSAGSKASLPFHPGALYAAVPESKNVSDILPFLPPASESMRYITYMATLERPFYESQKKTLAYAFSDEALLKRLNKKTGEAASKYMNDMKKLSEGIRKRTFDKKGLCQGMPFCWKALDPGSVPFFFSS